LKEIILENEKKLILNGAPLVEANNLRLAFIKALSSVGISFILLNSAAELINAIAIAETDPAFRIALFECLKHCIYNNEPVKSSLFEDMDAREQYYTIINACVMENISPFFKDHLTDLVKVYDMYYPSSSK
jgi:hypothetical protein